MELEFVDEPPRGVLAPPRRGASDEPGPIFRRIGDLMARPGLRRLEQERIAVRHGAPEDVERNGGPCAQAGVASPVRADDEGDHAHD
jgi:hypothetical protein